MPDRSCIALPPQGKRSWLAEAVLDGGARIVPVRKADGLVWTDPADPAGLAGVLHDNPQIGWIQLPWAGIEPYVDIVRTHADRTWTCAKGVYAEPVAEHALALALAGLRHLGPYAGARVDPPGRREPARRDGSRSSAAVASPRACSACSARSAATSRWCGASPHRCRGPPGAGGERHR